MVCIIKNEVWCLKKNLNASRPSEHPAQGGNVETLRLDHRLQIQNIFMAFTRLPVTLGQQYNVGEKATVILYTYCTSIAMQGHQKKTLQTKTL